MDDLFRIIGCVCCAIGGAEIALCLLLLLGYWAALLWEDASRRWRNIFKAEKLICEYRAHKAEIDDYLSNKEKYIKVLK